MKGPARTPLSPRVGTFIMERGPVVRRWILMGLAAGVPIFFLRTGSDPFNVPKLALLISGLSVVVALRVVELSQGASTRGLERLLVPAAFMAIPLSVSWLFADFRYWSLFGLFARFQGLIPYLLVILFGILVADAFAGETRALAWSFLVAAAVVGGYAIVQFLGLDPFNWQFGTLTTRAEQTLSTLGNPNFTGGFLGIAMPIAVAVWIADPAKRSRLKKMVPLIAVGWLLTRSEGGWAAGVAGTAIVLGLFLRKRWKLAPLLGGAVAGGMALLVTGAVLITLVQPLLRLPFTAEERGHWWVAAARMGADSPIVGHGPNSFAVIGVQYRIREEALEQGFNYTDDPHSVPLSLFSGSGALGLLGYLALVGWVFYRSVGIDPNDFLSMGFLGGSFAYLVQSLVSIDELSLRVGFWGVLAGLAITSDRRIARAGGATDMAGKRKNKPAQPKPRKRPSSPPPRQRKVRLKPRTVVVAIISAVVVAVAGWWSVGFIVADARFRAGLGAIEREEPDQGRREVARALAFRDEYRFRHLAAFQLGRLAVDRGVEAEGLIDEMGELLSYLGFFPDVPAIRDYGRLLHEWHPHDRLVNGLSLAHYRRAVSLDPFNPLLRAEAASVAVEAERYDLVAELVRPALEASGDEFPQLRVALAEAEHRLGNLVGALETYRELIEQSPQSSDYREKAADVALDLRRYEEVVELVSSVAGTAGSPILWGQLAFAHAKLGHEDESQEAIERALELDPDQALALRAKNNLLRAKTLDG